MVPQWWDNGNDFYDRINAKWRDVTTKNIVIAAAAGKINTIPYVCVLYSLWCFIN
jgi:hypothetical protein